MPIMDPPEGKSLKIDTIFQNRLKNSSSVLEVTPRGLHPEQS